MNALRDDKGNSRLRDALQAGDPPLDFVRRAVHRHPPVARIGASGNPEVLHVHHAALGDVVQRDVQRAIADRELDDGGSSEAREERIIQPGARGRSSERRGISRLERHDRESIAVIEIALQNRADRVAE